MKRLLVLCAVIIGLISLPLIKQSATAQTGDEERITLSPAISRPELSAGQTAKGKLTVINDGTVPYTFLLYARPFSVNNEAYEPNYTEVNERTEAYQWVQFEQTKVTLQPDERVEVGYTVKVPTNAAPGGHYAVLFAETQPKDENASVSRKKRVGSLLYMTIDGNLIQEGSVASWQAALLQTTQPVTSTLRITNSGNVHFQANITVRYANLFGKIQFEKNQEVLVLPGTTRRIPFQWEDAPYLGVFKASGQVNFLNRTETLPGKWIILFPKSLVVIIAAVVIVGLAWFVVRPRLLKRRKSKVARRNGDK